MAACERHKALRPGGQVEEPPAELVGNDFVGGGVEEELGHQTRAIFRQANRFRAISRTGTKK